MNKIIIIGNLGSDPEITTDATGKATKATVNVAVRRSYKNREGQYESDWFRVVEFNENRIKFLSTYFHKGDSIVIDGRVQTGSYTKQDGTKGYSFDIIPNTIEFAGSSRRAEGTPTQQQPVRPQPQQRPRPQAMSAPSPQDGIPTDSGFEETLPWS